MVIRNRIFPKIIRSSPADIFEIIFSQNVHPESYFPEISEKVWHGDLRGIYSYIIIWYEVRTTTGINVQVFWVILCKIMLLQWFAAESVTFRWIHDDIDSPRNTFCTLESCQPVHSNLICKNKTASSNLCVSVQKIICITTLFVRCLGTFSAHHEADCR